MNDSRINARGAARPVFFFLLSLFCVPRLPQSLSRAAEAPAMVAKTGAAETVAAARATDGAQELGEGLCYFRAADFRGRPGGLRDALARHSALVVDLRGAAAGPGDARALRAALTPGDPKARVARFVLIDKETAAAIPIALGAGLPQGGVRGVVVLALSAAGVPADVAVPGAPEEGLPAREALAKGAAVTTLINHQPEKRRYDEAALMREHQGLPEAEGEDAGAEPADGALEKKSGQPLLTDPVLQAAVQTHRALVALKRL